MTRIAMGCVLVFALLSCGEPVGPSDNHSNVRLRAKWLTGNAAAAVNPVTAAFRGLLPATAILDTSDVQILADGFVAIVTDPSNVGNSRQVAAADRGGPISWGSLRRCKRLTYSISPIGTAPPALPPLYRRVFSSQWAVPRCGRDGSVHLSVGVSDAPATTLLGALPSQWVVSDSLSGRFSLTGIPVRFPLGLPVTPEQAVAHVFLESNVRISETPVAYNQYSGPGIGELPPCASWRIVLEVPIRLRREPAGTELETREVYVRHSPACFSSTMALFVPVLPHPTERWIAFQTSPMSGPDSVLVPVTGPVQFDRVTVVR
jgi:hypothetical protein